MAKSGRRRTVPVDEDRERLEKTENRPRPSGGRAWRAAVVPDPAGPGRRAGQESRSRRSGGDGTGSRERRRRPPRGRHPPARKEAGQRGQGEGRDRPRDVATAAACQPLDAARPEGGDRRNGDLHRARHPERRGLEPHRVKTFKVSRDHGFEKKIHDVTGLYAIRRTTPWYSRWTRSPRYRRRVARGRRCRRGRARGNPPA